MAVCVCVSKRERESKINGNTSVTRRSATESSLNLIEMESERVCVHAIAKLASTSLRRLYYTLTTCKSVCVRHVQPRKEWDKHTKWILCCSLLRFAVCLGCNVLLLLHIWYTPNGCRYMYRQRLCTVCACMCASMFECVGNGSLRPFLVPQR